MAASIRQVRCSVSICQRCLHMIQACKIVDSHCQISTTTAVWRNMKWREREDIARSQEYGPLSDLRDWSYLDGRDTPLKKGQQKRKEEQREIAKRIDQLASEMMKAVNDHKSKIQSEEDARIQRQAIKLKAKGSKYKKQEKLHRVIP